MTPNECSTCKSLRGVEVATPLEMCQDRLMCLKLRLCEYHCYEMFGMCSLCLIFIQDPQNDQQLREWESNNERSKISSAKTAESR